MPLHVSPAAQAGIERLAQARTSGLRRQAELRRLMPDPAQTVSVRRWAGAHGFSVTATTPWTVSLRGRAGSLATAFGTSLRTAEHHGKAFVAPSSAPVVPAALRGVADAVVGLDTRPLWSGRTVYGGGDVQVLNSTPLRGSTAGAGATVATVNLSGWHTSDLTTYRRAAFGSTAPAPAISTVTVGSGHVGATVLEDDYGMETEVALDAETIAGVAPAAQQRMYFGGDSSADYVAILNKMAADLVATPGIFQTASSSWGACEMDVPMSDLGAMRAAITQITAAGATFFAASGDSGAFDCDYLGDDGAAVDFPAAAENAVAVGGTTVAGNAAGYTSTAWSGSGGGCSALIPAPARQVALGTPCKNRSVPDIATIADPGTGFWVYDRVDEWMPVGGTSLAAPASAAGLAVAQAHAGLSNLVAAGGFLNTAYQNPAAFTDVTAGDNGLYRATAGYDLVSGLGSPQWTAVEAALTGTAAPVPTGHNEPLLAIDPTSDPYSAPVTVEMYSSSPELGFIPNGEPVSGYAISGTQTTSCASTTPAPPASAALLGGDGTKQLSLSVATSDPDVPSGCLTVQRPVVVDSHLPVAPLAVATNVGTTSPAYRFSWAAATDPSPSSGILFYVVQVTDVTADEGVDMYVTTGRVGPLPIDGPLKVVAGHTYAVRLIAIDAAWNVGERTATFIAPLDDTRVSLSKHLSSGVYVSDWARTKSTADYLGSHIRGSRKGASYSIKVTAKTITLGLFKNPYGGYADVYLDGVRKTRISLYAAGNRYRQQVRVVSLAARGTHTLKVVVTGAHQSGSKGNVVYLDSITLTT